MRVALTSSFRQRDNGAGLVEQLLPTCRTTRAVASAQKEKERAAAEAQGKDWLHILAGDFAHVVGGFACVQGAAMLGTGSRALRVAHEKVVRGMNADLPADDRVAIVPREGGGVVGGARPRESPGVRGGKGAGAGGRGYSRQILTCLYAQM